MRLAALDDNPKRVRGRHDRSGPHRNHIRRNTGDHVQTKHRIGHEISEQALLDHQLSTAFLTFRRALLGGLKNKHHLAGELFLDTGQRFRHTHQNCDMRIMSAGMHHAGLLAAELGGHPRGKRQVHLLGYRQRIHVGTQRDARSGLAATQDADYPRVSDARTYFQAETLQVLGHQGCGAEFPVAQLGVLVNIAAPFHHFGFYRCREGVDISAVCDRDQK